MVTQRTQFSNCCMGLVEETGPTDQSNEMEQSHNWARSSLRLSFFTNGSGTPMPVSKLVKDLGVQTDNMFFPFVHCTEVANKARRLIFMPRRSFQDLLKSDLIPLYGALVRPHLEYGMPARSPNRVADINHLYVTQLPALYMWFLQARCGLLFTIINKKSPIKIIKIITIINQAG